MSYSYVSYKMFINEIAPILQVIFNSHSTKEYPPRTTNIKKDDRSQHQKLQIYVSNIIML